MATPMPTNRTPGLAFFSAWIDRLPGRVAWGLLGWLWLQIQRFRAPRTESRSARGFQDAFLEGANLPWFSCGNDFGGNAWHPEGGISGPGNLIRGRTGGENLQAAGAQVPGEVHEDVDGVLPDLPRGGFMGQGGDVPPVVDQALQPRGDGVGGGQVGVGIHLHLGGIVMGEQGLQEIGHRMLPEVGEK